MNAIGAGVLGFFVPGGFVPVLAALARPANTTSIQGALVPPDPGCFLSGLRLPDLFQHWLCHQPKRHPCGAVFIAQWGVGFGLAALARKTNLTRLSGPRRRPGPRHITVFALSKAPTHWSLVAGLANGPHPHYR